MFTLHVEHSYFAPEYFMHGIVDEKIDVFSYGVLVLELITGRQALDDSQKSLVLWVSFNVHVCIVITCCVVLDF